MWLLKQLRRHLPRRRWSEPAWVPPVSLVVGLGNPGQAYLNTRHNVGFLLLDRLISRWQANEISLIPQGICYTAVSDQGSLLAMKPMTYMNLSGDAVSALSEVAPVTPARMLICYDDVSLPLGTLRVRASGSAGGHKGLQHILGVLESDAVPRLRLGIDSAGREGSPLKDFVLQPFAAEEQDLVLRVLDRAADAVDAWLHQDIQAVMGQYNGPVPG